MRIHRNLITVFILVFGLAAAVNVLAIGSGAGGSVTPSCTADTWTCTDWSACSTSGAQTRNCTLTYDCPGVNTPEPAASQSCTPPAPPAVPPQAVPSSPATAPQAPSCTATKWDCTSWSASCDIYGLEHRTCHVVSECPANPTPSPINSEACTHLQCGNLPTLHDRIACRLNLAPEGATQELKIQYLPEECRVVSGAPEKQECIARYKSYQPCWNLPAGEGRFVCAEQALGLGTSTVADDFAACQSKVGADQVSCKANLKDKVLYMIKFRFYDLEQRAEDLARRGADLGAVADLETAIETQKQTFDAAKTKDQLMQDILAVRSAWQDFVNQVKNQVK
ncbi:MAG TPA: hypothetical protein VNG29_01985 [Candidatus Paceibacterota bacterium]|nr:hypothetical protein [Candidatus Paceibacterota bacterium]